MHGYLLVDKPVGPSSHAAVQQVRRTLGIGGKRGTKAGHAGTLDPFASGLLVVLVGRATRLMPFVVGHDKRYLVDVTFGASSDTDDSTGTLTASGALPPDEAALDAALATLAASTEQVPPAVSAIHVDGVRAYQRVRRGEVVDVPPRTVRFDAIELVERSEREGLHVVRLDVRCGTGTYMRALARDLGELVGCPAHCSALRRLEVGEWSVADARGCDDVRPEDLRDPLDLVPGLHRVSLDDVGVADIAAGRRVAGGLAPADVSDVAFVAPDGTLAGLGRRTSYGALLQPTTVLVESPGVRGSSA